MFVSDARAPLSVFAANRMASFPFFFSASFYSTFIGLVLLDHPPLRRITAAISLSPARFLGASMIVLNSPSSLLFLFLSAIGLLTDGRALNFPLVQILTWVVVSS